MSTSAFHRLSQVAAEAVSRRRSLVALGGAALAAGVTNPRVGVAKNKKKCKKKIQQTCDQQMAQCQAAVEVFCGETDPDCLDALLPCCDLLADCDTGSAVTCICTAFPIHV